MANEQAQLYYVSVQAIIKAEGKALALHKLKMSDGMPCDLWTLPGGKMNPNETEMETLSRELHEELGLVVDTKTVPIFVGYYISNYSFQNGTKLLMLMFEINLPELFTPQISSEHEKFLWLTWIEFLATKFHSEKVTMSKLLQNLN